jgi:hypothetical protein
MLGHKEAPEVQEARMYLSTLLCILCLFVANCCRSKGKS